MRYLFFLISFLYSVIFYLFFVFSQKKDIWFHDTLSSYNILNLSLFDSVIFSDSQTIILQSFFGNLLYEVIFFFFLGIIFFFLFSSSGKSISSQQVPEISHVPTHKIHVLKIFKSFSYYIGFFFFYLSVYFITQSFDFITFSLFICIVNIVIFLFFFLSRYSSLSKDFLRINSIIFSLYYIFHYVLIIVTDNNYFTWIDFLNSFLIVGIYPVLLYQEKKITQRETFDYSLLINFSVYIFAQFLFYFYFYLFHQNLIFWISCIATFFGIVWFEGLPKFDFLRKNKLILRYIGIIFTYIGIVFGVIYLSLQYSGVIFLSLVLQVFYNIFIHKKYSNYISLFLGIFLIFFLVIYAILSFELIDFRSENFLIFSIIFSFLSVLLTYIFSSRSLLDTYIVHLFSHLYNFSAVVVYFLYNDFEILKIGILLGLESLYFFLSYNKLNPKKLPSNTH